MCVSAPVCDGDGQVVALESFLHNPMYVFPVQDGNGVTTCVSANFGSAFMRTLSSVMSIEGTGNKTQTLKEIATEAKHANRCVVLFAEGVRSNGDGVLRYRAEVIVHGSWRLAIVSNIVIFMLRYLAPWSVLRASTCICWGSSTPARRRIFLWPTPLVRSSRDYFGSLLGTRFHRCR